MYRAQGLDEAQDKKRVLQFTPLSVAFTRTTSPGDLQYCAEVYVQPQENLTGTDSWCPRNIKGYLRV